MFWLALSSWRDASPVGGESWPFDPGHLYSISTSLPSIICILQFCILLAAACLLSSVFYYQAPICPHTQLAKETEIIEALHVIHHSGNKAFMLHKFICRFLGVEERNFLARVLCKFGSLGCKMAIQSWFETWGKHQLGGKLKRPHTFLLDFFWILSWHFCGFSYWWRFSYHNWYKISWKDHRNDLDFRYFDPNVWTSNNSEKDIKSLQIVF